MEKKIKTLVVEKEPKKVVLRAPLLTQSGYGVHARQVVRWLFDREDRVGDIKVYTELLPWGNTPWIVDTQALNGLVGRIAQVSEKQEHYDVSFQLQLPNEWNPFLADVNIGLSAIVESDLCNPDWIKACNGMDLVITPSDFAKRALVNTGNIEVPIKVVPEAFPDEMADETIQGLELPEVKTDFNFLVFGQVTGNNPENDRKNLLYTMKWFMDAFPGREDIGIVVKTNMGRSTKLDRLQTARTFGHLIAQIKAGAKGPKFYLLHGNMQTRDVAALYKSPKIKALVSFTRGEGFGLPLLEAAACDLPVIATNWSAHTEFLNKGKFVKVDYLLTPVHESRVDNNIWMANARWANVKSEDAIKKLQKFQERPQVPQQWAKELGTILRSTHSFDSIAKAYTDLLDGKYI